MIEKAKTTFSLSYACLANQVGLSYRTLMRWKRRLADGKDAVEKRGPKKVRPLNLNELKKPGPGSGSRP
jgi:transposase